jgi:hypothetical protein
MNDDHTPGTGQGRSATSSNETRASGGRHSDEIDVSLLGLTGLRLKVLSEIPYFVPQAQDEIAKRRLEYRLAIEENKLLSGTSSIPLPWMMNQISNCERKTSIPQRRKLKGCNRFPLGL